MMLTTDLALRMDPIYEPISRRFHEHPDELADAFAKAWYKLLHRDMGPVSRYLGPWVAGAAAVAGPGPAVDHELVDDADVAALKAKILASGLSVSQLVATAWAAAASFRGTDKRGGANGARIRLAPQKDWEVNEPAELAKVLPELERIQQDFNGAQSAASVSLADVIVLGGCAAVEQAAKDAGYDVTVPFAPGRTDASQEQTDVESFAVLEPIADGFRNYLASRRQAARRRPRCSTGRTCLTLTAPEMTVLVGGMRVLGANHRQSQHGVFTDRPGHADERLLRQPARHGHGVDGVVSRARLRGPRSRDGDVKWTATAVDLVFGSHSQLRAIAEVYASDDGRRSSSATSSPRGSRS